MKIKEILKQIKIKKGVKQLIFISMDCGLSKSDLENFPHEILGKENMLVLIEGNVQDMVKVVKILK